MTGRATAPRSAPTRRSLLARLAGERPDGHRRRATSCSSATYNSYAKETPITTLEAGGFTNLVEKYQGADAYSYVFDGQWGYLDHALGVADPASSQVTGVADYHINADEPSVLDYNTDFKSAGQLASLYAPDEFRVSDHDPVLVGLTPDAGPTTPRGSRARWPRRSRRSRPARRSR